MGKSSPTSGNGEEDSTCRASDDCPIPVPAGVDVAIDGQHVTVKGPKGDAVSTPSPSRSPSSKADDGTLEVTRPDDERAAALAARPDPHADQQHGRRRHRGLREEARDRRRRLPRRGQGLGPRVRARLQPPDHRRGPRGHHLRRREPDPVLGVRASTSSRSARSPPTSASCASPSPYKGKGVRYAGEHIRRKVGKAGK